MNETLAQEIEMPNRIPAYNPYRSRSLVAAHACTRGDWDSIELADAYCLDAPNYLPAGSCVKGVLFNEAVASRVARGQ